MKIPFTLDADDFDFVPSAHIAKRQDLTENEKATVSMLDVIDQRSRRGVQLHMTHRWWLLVLTGLILAVNGDRVLAVALKWAGVSQ